MVAVGWQGRPALSAEESLAAALTSLLPAAARPEQGGRRPGGAPRARVRRGRAPAASRAAAARAHPACRNPCFIIVLDLFSCIGS